MRDSVLTRLENMNYEAYVHVCAILWKVAFEELRGLTNKKSIQDSGVGLNPMELNDLYDHMWNMGTLLQSQDCLSVLEVDYRPWPRVRLSMENLPTYAPSITSHKHLRRPRSTRQTHLPPYNPPATMAHKSKKTSEKHPKTRHDRRGDKRTHNLRPHHPQ